MSSLRTLAVTALAAALAGCYSHGVVITAREAGSPVLLGPVRSLGGSGQRAAPLAPAAAADQVKLSLTAFEGLNIKRPIATCPEGLSPRSSKILFYGTPAAGDWATGNACALAAEADEITLATSGDAARRVELRSIECGGRTSFVPCNVGSCTLDDVWCEIEGDVRAPPGGSPARQPRRPAAPPEAREEPPMRPRAGEDASAP
ncbi:MAG TPA: hypothetical protein VFP50_07815 [Anaeromyxobacteraceae bacterium]|nr:hypothetical protein [Anaeromyxobacteraceae bacterium]